jgi:hypothetical protein
MISTRFDTISRAQHARLQHAWENHKSPKFRHDSTRVRHDFDMMLCSGYVVALDDGGCVGGKGKQRL